MVVKNVRNRKMRINNSKEIWNDSSGCFPKSFIFPLHLFSKKTATSLKFHSFVVYSAHVVWLNPRAKQRVY